MSTPSRCRPRFKGIETFLRRIAFNLGNTASQTEVKIISCIPIDVTDLQNRICELEREVENYCVRVPPPNVRNLVHTALVAVPTPEFSPPRPLRSSDVSGGPATTPPAPAPPRGRASRSPPPVRASISSRTTVRPSTSHTSNHALIDPDPLATYDPPPAPQNKHINRKRRKNTQLVYYTQTATHSPFEFKRPAANAKRTRSPQKAASPPPDAEYQVKEDMSDIFLKDMIRRQYEEYSMTREMSDTSEFSTPVCRDTPADAGVTSDRPLSRYDSEMCSCCRGGFHNMDDALRLPAHNSWDPTTTQLLANSPYGQANNMFYDSSLYDVVPVRDEPEPDSHEYKYPKHYAEQDLYFTRNKRAKLRKLHAHTVAPMRINPRYVYRKKANVKPVQQRKDSLTKLNPSKKKNLRKKESVDPNSAIDFSAIYVHPSALPKKTRRVEVKNAECLTMNLNNSECQTASSKSVQLDPQVPDQNKTEITLNQIKTILQTVLTEVKTSAQLKCAPERTVQKDAIVQKGQSQNNIQMPGLPGQFPNGTLHPMQPNPNLNNYNYSPYNMYGASCSRTMPAPVPPVSPFQPKCMQNYPLFIQHTGGGQCTCCYRTLPKSGTNNAPQPVPRRPPPATATATVAATNTEQPGRELNTQRSRETDKLIQEIYKSLAVNMDYFNKNTSNSEYSELKSSPSTHSHVSRHSQKVELSSPPAGRRATSGGALRNEPAQRTWATNLPASKTTVAHVSPALVSTHSHTPSNRTLTTSYSKETEPVEPARLRKKPSYRRGRKQSVERSSTHSHSTLVSDDYDSDATVVEYRQDVQKKPKASLFKKVVSLFSGKKKSKRGKSEVSEVVVEAEDSDSDGYQTVYSVHSEHPRQTAARQYRRVRGAASKASGGRASRQKSSPYLEQEERREWAERLTYRDDKRGYQRGDDDEDDDDDDGRQTRVRRRCR